MPGGTIAVTPRVIARNRLGQFIRECEQAADATVADAVKQGEELSRALAPVGHKPDPRTVTLKAGMFSRSAGTTGYWGCRARHALVIEFGGAPHEITGWVKFFWEREGRMWAPGRNMIHHPGTPAHPYLRPAFAAIMNRSLGIAKKYYP